MKLQRSISVIVATLSAVFGNIVLGELVHSTLRVVDHARGEVIGVNGRSADLILENYQFQDGNYPKPKLQEQMRALNWGVPIEKVREEVSSENASTFLSKSSYPSEKETEKTDEVAEIANAQNLTGIASRIQETAAKITVRIDYPNGNGSGVIIAQQGNTYYVLTADHVVKKEHQYQVVTPDGESYSVEYSTVKRLEEKDLAVLRFQSQKTYQVATLANYHVSEIVDKALEQGIDNDGRFWVFLFGWQSLEGKSQVRLTAGSGEIIEYFALSGASYHNPASTYSQGYELIYTSPSQGGMSGGPLLDSSGKVIGIHAAAEGERAGFSPIQVGYSLGVPIKTFLSLAHQAGIETQWLNSETSVPQPITKKEEASIVENLFNLTPPENNAKETDWLNYANDLWRLNRFEEAIAAFDEAIILNPDSYLAYYGRGMALANQKGGGKEGEELDDWIEDWMQDNGIENWADFPDDDYSMFKDNNVLEITGVFFAKTRQKYREAVASFEKATQINPNFYPAWKQKGSTLRELASVTETSQLSVFPQSPEEEEQKPSIYLEEALASFNKAIALNPTDDSLHFGKGQVLQDLGRLREARDAYSEAIKINPRPPVYYQLRSHIYGFLGETQKEQADLDRVAELTSELPNRYGSSNENLIDAQPGLMEFTGRTELLYPELELQELNELYNEWSSEHYDDKELQEREKELRKQLWEQDSQRYQEGLAKFNRAIKINSKDADAYYNRGITYFAFEEHIDKRKHVLDAFRDTIKSYENEIELIGKYIRSENLNYQNQLSDLKKTVQSLQRHPQLLHDYEAQQALDGQIQVLKLNYQIELIEKGLTDLQNAEQISCQQGNTYLCEELQSVVKYIQLGHKTVGSRYANRYKDRGWAYNRLGDKQKAIEDFQKAGQLYRQQGNTNLYEQVRQSLTLIQKNDN